MRLLRKTKGKDYFHRINVGQTNKYKIARNCAVEKSINELPQDLKNPLILTALEGRSHAETGELLGISPKAVEMKVYRARKLLLEKMGEMGF